MFKLFRKRKEKKQALLQAYADIANYHVRALLDECMRLDDCLSENGDRDQLESVLASFEAHNDSLRETIWSLQYQGTKGS